MYKLKKKYKDSSACRQGCVFKLSKVRQDQVEDLGLEKYFEKSKPKKSKPTDKLNGQLDNTNI
tara:strand:+ start:19887 stop:20075 length:189 start_codon:yes stop_codon:yes gene_type:complete